MTTQNDLKRQPIGSKLISLYNHLLSIAAIHPHFNHKLLRLLLCFLGAAPLFIIYKEFVAPRMNPISMKDQIASVVPEVSVVPRPLNDLNSSGATGTTLGFYGDTFEVPWKQLIGRRIVRDTAVITFAPHIGIIVWSPLSKVWSLPAMPPDSPTHSAHISYGEESAVLSVTPSQIRFFDPPQLSASRVSLLLRKALSGGSEFKTGLYRFHTAATRGFQIGDPAKSARVRLDFFDPAGNSLGGIICVFGKDASARGTQAELNRIIQTFHPIPPDAKASAKLTPSAAH